MKTLLELKCPSCAAQLSVEDDREFIFCQYCGTKILVSDENKYTYRHIDDADIKRAETERMVQLKEMELEEKKQGGRKALIILWAAGTALIFLVGIILICIGDEGRKTPGYLLIMLGMNAAMWGGLGLFSGKKKDKRRSNTQRGIKISSAIADAEGKNYEAMVSMLKAAGFSNITCVPMKDLNLFTARKNGQIDSIVIDGDENISEGDIYSADAAITITYHSRA